MIFPILIMIFFNLQKIGALKTQISRFKVLAGKDVTSHFSNKNLISESRVHEKTDCLSLCNQNNLCSTALYKQNKECQLFNKLAEDDALTASSENDVFVKYPRSCKQIKRFNPQSKNGLYGIDTPNGKIQVFCEFEFDNEGFTFLSRESLDIADQNFLKDIYLNQTIVLTKYMTWNQTNQSYLFIQQLDQYSNQSIIITINQGRVHYRTTSPKYYRVSLVNDSNSCQINNTFGFKVNGNLYTYRACNQVDILRIFVFYQNLLDYNSTASCRLPGKFVDFINKKTTSNNNMLVPSTFFYTTAIFMGGCGETILSNCANYQNGYAFALGLK